VRCTPGVLFFARGALGRENARMPSPLPHENFGPVLFFDGECGLCNRLVRLLLRVDRGGRLHFAPLQGATAQHYLRTHGLPPTDFDTIIYVPDWSRRDRPEYLVRTAGVIAALRATGAGFARVLAALIALFPARIRDAGYRAVGHWRYRFFGPWRSRPLARAEWARRFLP
jgi:predicted DCC family thiol-disulfide oxidoreductase YuxK